MTDQHTHPLRYIKMCVLSIFGWAAFISCTLFFSILSIILSFFDKSRRLAHAVGARGWGASVLMMVGVKTRVSGQENLDPGKAYVVVANHISWFDILVLTAHLPLQFRWISKKEVYKVPLMGKAMERVGYVSIDRENKEKAWAHLFEAKTKLEEGLSLMFFPEGTRSPDGEIKRFKPGAFVLSLHTGVPVLPITIVGTREIMRKRSLLFHPGTVDLIILPPISPAGFTLEQKHGFAEVVRNLIAAEYQKHGAAPGREAPLRQSGPR